MFFVLDQGQLGTDKVGITPTLVLDQNELNTYGISYDGYDSDLAYNTDFFTYDGVFNWQITALASLQDLNATLSVQITKILTGLAELGALQASANESIANFAHASATLGELQANSDSLITNNIELNASLGALIAQAASKIDNFTSASANLGELTASASSFIPTPPQPEQQLYGSNPYYKQVIKKKVKPQPEPKIKVIIEPPKDFPPFYKTHFSKIDTKLTELQANSDSIIEFSILEDEAELLMLV